MAFPLGFAVMDDDGNDYLDDLPAFEKFSGARFAPLPTSGQTQRTAAYKKTDRSRRVARRIGKSKGTIAKRRHKRAP